MWIRWRYNDHGWRDFEELELPEDLSGYESVEDYLIEHCRLPVWSERYDRRRIHWEKLELPADELERRRLKRIADTIAYHRRAIERLQAQI